jgi:putative Ca2+/H+ antiporter (TMEM165/GDT1 family)
VAEFVDLAVLASTFAVIFPAELPDKSFIATLVLATRYRRLPVWLGAVAAFGIQMVIAVAAGKLLSLLPRTPVLAVTAVLFAVGAAFLIRGGMRGREESRAEEAEEEAEVQAQTSGAETTTKSSVRVFLLTFGVLFAAEWGDITQLVTAGLAATTGSPVSVFAGSWLALIAVAGIGVLSGAWLRHRIPLWRIRWISGIALAIIAGLTVIELVRT